MRFDFKSIASLLSSARKKSRIPKFGIRLYVSSVATISTQGMCRCARSSI